MCAKMIALTIKDPTAYSAAQEIAERTGETLTAVVRTALQERLERVRTQAAEPNLAERLREIAIRCSSYPRLDSRSDEEILDYNGAGISE